MSDIIHLLPDSVANQIAAGEVIQRPASVIKELVENSIDAGATLVKVIVVGAGRTSIQVIDNGKGMSSTDARIAFERHATSKIKCADDLFALNTMGFRGEALASIAAIAHVELRTRREEDELGTLIEISGSKVDNQEVVQCAKGTSFVVKNLFYNVPARRKFLKSDDAEMRNIITEMNRVMLAHPDVAFQFYNEDDLMYDVLKGTFMQRVVALVGKKKKNISQKLLKIEARTSIVNIEGYVGAPEVAGKNPQQYFFVNERYMYHAYFRKAVIHAYERMLPSDMTPMFFIRINVEPSSIDVNIHPTKTEVKFEDEKAIWSILAASVKEALGKFNIVPSIDFDVDDSITMPVYTAQSAANAAPAPKVTFNPGYSPFSFTDQRSGRAGGDNRNWREVFDGLNDAQTVEMVESAEQQLGFEKQADDHNEIMMYKDKYLCVSGISGLMIVNIHRAIMRLEYDNIRKCVDSKSAVSQKVLFPEVFEANGEDVCIFTEIEPDLRELGFEFNQIAKNSFLIEGVPAQMTQEMDVWGVIEDMLLSVKEKVGDVKGELTNIITQSLAKSISISKERVRLSKSERESFVGQLFQSSNPNYAPDGKKIISIIEDSVIDRLF